MKKTLFVLCGVMFFLVMGFAQREKTETIGKFSWYTEQNSFEEILQVAQKANKPILAVFSAVWCGPCQQVKASVFKSDDFKKVADEVVLLYIEQTTKEGAAYNSKYKVNSYPSFKIFSMQSILLDNGQPKRSVDGFLDWIRDVNAGKNFYEFSKKLEENPNDREILVKITDKLGWGEKDVIIDYLKRAIRIKPDFNDELSQEAYEKLAFYLVQSIPFKEGKEKEEFLAGNQKLFQGIVDAYYPDKFKYELKGNYGLNYILNWFYRSWQFEKVLAYFNDFLKRKGDGLDFVQDAAVFAVAVPNFITLGKVDAADLWIARIRDFSKKNESSKADQDFVHYYFQIFNAIIEYYGKKGRVTEAEEYAGIFYEEMTRLGQGTRKEFLMEHYAAKYGIFAETVLKSVDEQLKTASGMQVVRLTTVRAAILGKMGKIDEAKKSLLKLYENEVYFKNLGDREVPQALNLIAWVMVELKIVDQTSLEIAKKAVSLNPVSANMDTLACVYAELGNFKEAVKIEKEAMATEVEEYSRKEYSEKIRKWQEKLK